MRTPEDPSGSWHSGIEASPAVLAGADPILWRLYTYWSECRGGQRMPRRADLDVADILPVTQNVKLLEVLEGGADFHIRLLGTALVDLYGQEVTGRRLSDLAEREWTSFIGDVYRHAIATRRPIFHRAAFTRAELEQHFGPLLATAAGPRFLRKMATYTYERLVLPLGDEAGVTMLLVGLVERARDTGPATRTDVPG